MTTTDAQLSPDLASELELLLSEFLREHRELEAVIERHRDAIRRADAPAMRDAMAAHASALGRIAELEQVRRKLVDRAAPPTPGRHPGPITLTSLARSAPAQFRDRLVALAQSLADLIRTVAAQERILRAAAGQLLTHVEGVMKQVAHRLSHTQTYGSRGRIDVGAPVLSAVDVVT